ncbi:MAB_1171c family putative transporter [Amycolatopsis minnesotensis]|uniref:DUF6545 domain-containing protein n=1 Tax=Amycolatopsis minnesotensis TaxID=337894 RepID=A0ABN2SRL2_9PSEU
MSAALMSYALAIGLGVVTVIRVRRLATAANKPAVRASVLLVSGMAVTFAAMAPPSQAWVNRFVPDLFKLVGNSSTLVAMFGAAALVLHTRYPADIASAKTKPRAVLLVVALVVMIATFAAPHPAVLTGSFDGLYAIDPLLVLYTTAYALYFGGTLLSLTAQFFQLGRAAGPLFRVALFLFSLGSLVGVAHNVATLVIVGHNVVTGAREGAGGPTGVCTSAFNDPACFIAIGTPAIAAAIAILGFALAAAATSIARARRRNRHGRAYRRLEPLWRQLTGAFPEIVRHEDQPRTRNLHEHLSHRVVEILDGLLLLAPYRSATVLDRAAAAADRERLAGEGRAAVVEACAIIAALRNHTDATRPTDTPPPPPAHSAPDIDAETAWLELVAVALDTSPIVGSFR